MKKRGIAIALVLVIALVGAFASNDNAIEGTSSDSLNVKTSVNGFDSIIITADQPAALATYADFAQLSSIADAVAVGKASQTVGYLSYFSNQSPALKVKFSAENMKSDTADSEIIYTVTCDGVSVTSNGDGSGTAVSSPVTLIAAGTKKVSQLGTKAISVDVDNDSYDNAAAATDYEGTITFNILNGN